ncbi:DMT family transporter [Erythrobacter litoralis]|uniref:Putative membrane protein n=1 Tax=Erythrobacter litoralis (strain HTCC2594) TaxID=314225 RepID=Q2NCL8_ERYLH|nr:DMT family transporter [Erythrobacter litoralis]ABC62573.1 putative membrane protein [Erythrobacter litoralis HTCC2594]
MDGSVARPRPLLALGLRLLTALSLATMAMLVKLGEQRGVHLLEMIFWRQAITLVVITGLLAWLGRLADIRTRRFGAHARRAIYGITGMMFVYGAVILLPLAEATTISFTTPMFAVLLALLLFREKIGLYRWGAVLVGFAGVAIVMQPGSGGAVDPFGIAIGLVAAFMVALISFQIQDLNTTETPYSIIFWFTALTAPLAALSLPFVLTAHDPVTWGIVLAMALCGAAAQILLTTSLRFGSAATIIVMDYTSLIWAVTYGWTVFDRVPPPTLWLGAPLIICAGLLVAWREHRLKQHARIEELTRSTAV